MNRSVVVGTWSFSAQPVKVAARLVQEGHTCEECLEKALNVAEEDERYGPCQVGRAGPPNEKGEVELDAAMMSGHSLNFGAVTALQGVACASSVARCVMERSKHSMLTGQGAQEFAVQSGFHLDIPHTQFGDGKSRTSIDTEKQDKAGDGKRGTADGTERHTEAASDAVGQQHDTLGLIVLDAQGNVAAGVTTSGMKGKARGRIGDSALPGSGLYADNEVGAVCCSGEGDQIMKFCPSFMVMEFMRQGQSPGAACRTAVSRIKKRTAPSPPFELAIIAVNMEGEVGAASTVREWRDVITDQMYAGFPLAVWSQGSGQEPEIRVAPPVS